MVDRRRQSELTSIGAAASGFGRSVVEDDEWEVGVDTGRSEGIVPILPTTTAGER